MPRQDPRLKDIASDVNSVVQSRAIRHALFLEGFKTREQREIAQILDDSLIRTLNRLDGRLARAAAQGFDRGPATTERLRQISLIYSRMIEGVETQSYQKLRDDLFELARDESAFQIGFIQNSVPVNLEMVAPAAERLRSLVTSQPMDGRLIRQWFADATAKSKRNFSAMVNRAVAEGLTFQQIAQELRGTTFERIEDGVLKQFQDDTGAIVRSAVTHVSVHAKEEVFRENEDIVKGVQWVLTLDTKTCQSCVEAAERPTPLGKGVYPIDSGPRPPRHLNCLTGDALVLPGGRIVAATERRYEGEIVVIRTAGDRELTCTPNHPILTRRGWVAAGALDVGDHVVCQRPGERPVGADHQAENVPAPIKEVARAFLESEGVRATEVPTAAPDFHGDGAGSEVAVVGTDRELRDSSYTAFLNHPRQINLARTDMVGRWPGLPRDGSLTAFIQAAFAAAYCAMCGGGLARTLGGGHLGPLHRFGLALGSPRFALLPQYAGYDVAGDSVLSRDPVLRRPVPIGPDDRGSGQIDPLAAQHPDAAFPKNSRDDLLRYAELARQIIGGSAGPVFSEQVVSLIVKKASTHVFNLETSGGYYAANGIITGNCRCTTAPVLKSASELGLPVEDFPPGTRASMSGQVPEDLTYTEWLEGQSTEIQNEALGPSHATLFRKGLTRPSAYSTRTGHVRTLKEIRELEPDAFASAGVRVPGAAISTQRVRGLDDAARVYNLDAGRRTGNESLYAFDEATGEVLQQSTSNKTNFVAFSSPLMKTMGDPSRRIRLHHNHPSSRSLSKGDLEQLRNFPGMRTAFAHGHDGSSYQATMIQRAGFKSTYKTVEESTRAVLQKAVFDAGEPLTAAVAGRHHHHTINLALGRAGAVSYEARLSADRSAQFTEFEPIFEKAIGVALRDLRRNRG